MPRTARSGWWTIGSGPSPGPRATTRRTGVALLLAGALVVGCGATPEPSPLAPSPTSQPARSPVLPSTTPRPSLAPGSVAPLSPSPAPVAVATVGPDGIALVRSDVPLVPASPAAAASAAAGINAFGVDLYRRVATTRGNLVISPASVAIALNMARAGAQGMTAAQMDAVLHSVGSAPAHAEAIGSLDQALVALSGTYETGNGRELPVTLRLANAPFAQVGMSVQSAYLDALAAQFGAPLRLLDYAGNPDAARLLINAWVKAQTEGRIPALLSPPDITALTRLVLVNAVYLHAPWLNPFDPRATAPGAFTRPDGSMVRVPMMAVQDAVPYAAGTGWRAIELPYLGGSLALDVIVPTDLAGFEARLTNAEIARLTGAFKPQEVRLSLPRFGIRTETRLARTLGALGMPLAFDRTKADFSGIALHSCGSSPDCLYIAQVIHQATIDVDEKGTTAAAATAVVMVTGGPGYQGPWITFRVDRPFMFILRDRTTGAILFMGHVTDPSAKA
jgi:serine protease inhibitor